MTNATAEGTPGLVPSGDWIADPATCTVSDHSGCLGNASAQWHRVRKEGQI